MVQNSLEQNSSDSCTLKYYFKTLLKNLNNYINCDKSKDTKIIISDLSNPNISVHEIIMEKVGNNKN